MVAEYLADTVALLGLYWRRKVIVAGIICEYCIKWDPLFDGTGLGCRALANHPFSAASEHDPYPLSL
jgi:hypothetical protein